MKFFSMEKELVEMTIENDIWEKQLQCSEMEIQKKRKELHTKLMRLQMWETEMHDRSIDLIVTNGILIKKIYNA